MEINIQPKNQTKSQKRKNRLLKRGASIATTIASGTTMPTQSRRSSKRKNQRRNQRNQDARGTGPIVRTYLDALKFPEVAEGAKIPDEIGFPTGTFQLEHNGMLPTLSGGDSVGIHCTPLIGGVLANSTWPITIYQGSSSGNLISRTKVRWTDADSLTTMFIGYRPVSMSLVCQFVGPSTADGGRCAAGLVDVGDNGSYLGPSFETWTNYPNTIVFPLKNGVRVVWKPIDISNNIFVDEEGRFGHNATTAYEDCVVYPIIFAGFSGLPSNVSYIQYTVTCNFETVPYEEFIDFIDTSPSVGFDTTQLKDAFQWAQQSLNNVSQLADKAGAFVEYGKAMYGAYKSISDPLAALGYVPLPQRIRGRGRSHARMLPAYLLRRQAERKKSKETKAEGKEEEEEEDSGQGGETPLDRALQSFSRLQVMEENQSSPGAQARTQSPLLKRSGKG